MLSDQSQNTNLLATEARRQRRLAYRHVAEDGRSRWVKRRKVLVRDFTAALGRIPNVRDATLISNVAAIVVRLEQLRGDISRGKHVDDEEFVRLNNVCGRLIASLGLKAAPAVPAGPTLEQYLAARHGDNGDVA